MSDLLRRLEKLEQKFGDLANTPSEEEQEEAWRVCLDFVDKAAHEKSSGIIDGPYMTIALEALAHLEANESE